LSRRWGIKSYSWNEFEKIPGAMEAIVRAKWSCTALQKCLKICRQVKNIKKEISELVVFSVIGVERKSSERKKLRTGNLSEG
jgi:hypothetical protein